jgi:hypothetical protein
MTTFLRPREHIASGIRQIEEARANHCESMGDKQDSGQMVDMAKLADLLSDLSLAHNKVLCCC